MPSGGFALRRPRLRRNFRTCTRQSFLPYPFFTSTWKVPGTAATITWQLTSAVLDPSSLFPFRAFSTLLEFFAGLEAWGPPCSSIDSFMIFGMDQQAVDLFLPLTSWSRVPRLCHLLASLALGCALEGPPQASAGIAKVADRSLRRDCPCPRHSTKDSHPGRNCQSGERTDPGDRFCCR